jgi:hypothetical protein
MEWELVSRNEVPPFIIEIYRYRSRGRKYEVGIAYFYDEKGRKRIQSISFKPYPHGKERMFHTLRRFNIFLRRKRVPELKIEE